MRRDYREKVITEKLIENYKRKLTEDEKSKNTIDQYLRDIKQFQKFIRGNRVEKCMVIRYKEMLVRKYRARSVNAKLSALNSFFKWIGWYECTVKLLKIQNRSFRAGSKMLTKDEYGRLLAAAIRLGKARLCLVMQALCAMGLRVSELRFITVEAVHLGYAEVQLKGKTRTVLMPEDLRLLLEKYIFDQQIKAGCIFITKSGKPLDRSNIWRDMKALSREAGVGKSKVFPHNLRHLFACVFYEKEKNVNHLADILGHSSLDTTRIYTQVSMEEELEALNRLHLVDLENFTGKSVREVYG